GLHAFELRRQEARELRGQVNDAAVVVLRGAGVQAQRAGLEVDVAALKRQDLALRAPAEGVLDRGRDLEIRAELTSDRLPLPVLEEAFARRRLLELLDRREPEDLA